MLFIAAGLPEDVVLPIFRQAAYSLLPALQLDCLKNQNKSAPDRFEGLTQINLHGKNSYEIFTHRHLSR
ncbi:MAG: hypothetical protein ACD_75C00004G0005 [uncultured bacterium]|nr:MAG: hypothetical protein ACD_75C00004G0005 [uncultured bacterium]